MMHGAAFLIANLFFLSSGVQVETRHRQSQVSSSQVQVESSSSPSAIPMGRNLLFTSAGDHSSLLDNWVGWNRNYDIFVVYYGHDPDMLEQYQRHCRWVVQGQGSKAQNFHQHLFLDRRDLFNASDYIMSLDDDIIFKDGVEGINTMFETMREYKLKQAMPALTKNERTYGSLWAIEVFDPTPGLVLKYSSNVEHNSVCASREAWERTMAIYSPVIIGFGMPHLSVCANGENEKESYAVVHRVQAVNPPVHSTGEREGEEIEGWFERKDAYYKWVDRIGCNRSYPIENYESVFEAA
mmetsp:Transcript_13518/g.27382  ORF Transcript_13518/g.27382 Transcript_13518/m.27382 type:complete len:296 (+) Transcript_13518:476-1363(+)|eukprot:CAMPEP_0167792352 /NCGR_PEP_ID=MMETSP0111_2-20121227/12516_1 /TAXON_ID=91324 /ORGANISM="Lotharella globosa, Strain CCCM811" /LENGTH=295 /DNA_ID=CAMNT_0007685267 /DNA_START=452 /DNA_END=1339 /DNA_ORIENTATION=+